MTCDWLCEYMTSDWLGEYMTCDWTGQVNTRHDWLGECDWLHEYATCDYSHLNSSRISDYVNMELCDRCHLAL